jgi:hypothetical protein
VNVGSDVLINDGRIYNTAQLSLSALEEHSPRLIGSQGYSMQSEMNEDKQSIRRELGLLLGFIVLSICGLLIWTGLFLAVQWSVSAVWTAVVAHSHGLAQVGQ